MEQYMNVISFKEFDSVFGAVSINSQSDKQLQVEDIAYNGIRVHSELNADIEMHIPTAWLKVTLAKFDQRVFYRPTAFQLDDLIPELKKIWQAIGNEIDIDRNNNDRLTITLPSAVVSNVEAWVMVSGDNINSPIVISINFLQGNTQNEAVSLPLQPGDYTAMLMVPEYSTLIIEFSV